VIQIRLGRILKIFLLIFLAFLVFNGFFSISLARDHLQKIVSSHELPQTTIRATPNIRITTFMMITADWVNNVLNDGTVSLGTCEALVTGTSNIHTYEYSPSDILKVQQSDIFVKFGIGDLEPDVDQLIAEAMFTNPNLKILTLKNDSDSLFPIPLKMDPLLNQINPHFWMSPINAQICVNKTAYFLSQLYPDNASHFEHARDLYNAKLDALLVTIDTYKSMYQGTKVIINHPAFMYFLDLIGVIRMGVIEETEEGELSAAHLLDIINTIWATNTHLLITSPQASQDAVISLSRDTYSNIVTLTPLLPIYGLSTYIQMIEFDLISFGRPALPAFNLVTMVVISISGTLTIVGVAGALLYLRYGPSKMVEIDDEREIEKNQ